MNPSLHPLSSIVLASAVLISSWSSLQAPPPVAPPASPSAPKAPSPPSGPATKVEETASDTIVRVGSDAKVAIDACTTAPKDRPLIVVLEHNRVLSPADTRDLLEAIEPRRQSKAASLVVCKRVDNGEAMVALAADAVFIVAGSKIEGAAKSWCPPEGETQGLSDRLVRLVQKLSGIDRIFCERLIRQDSPLSFNEPLVFVREESGGQFIARRGDRLSIDIELAQKISKRIRKVASIEDGIAEARRAQAELIASQNTDAGDETAAPKEAKPKVPQAVDAELATYRTELGELKRAINEFEPYYWARPGGGVWTGRRGIRAVWKAGNTDMTRHGPTLTTTKRLQEAMRNHAYAMLKARDRISSKTGGTHPSLGTLNSSMETLESLRKAIEKNDADLYERSRAAALRLSAP